MSVVGRAARISKFLDDYLFTKKYQTELHNLKMNRYEIIFSDKNSIKRIK